MKTAQQLIDALDLKAHPEGGFYKEVYRSDMSLHSTGANATRNAITCIYFLLLKGQVSQFHRVKHDEVWNFYLGAPLRLIDINGDGVEDIILGDYRDKVVAQHVIKANNWQAAESTGDYSLVGCSVAPGFDFADFSFLSADESTALAKQYPTLEKFMLSPL